MKFNIKLFLCSMAVLAGQGLAMENQGEGKANVNGRHYTDTTVYKQKGDLLTEIGPRCQKTLDKGDQCKKVARRGKNYCNTHKDDESESD